VVGEPIEEEDGALTIEPLSEAQPGIGLRRREEGKLEKEDVDLRRDAKRGRSGER
jgi:hypothetical protein